jgi:hypothetical protein
MSLNSFGDISPNSRAGSTINVRGFGFMQNEAGTPLNGNNQGPNRHTSPADVSQIPSLVALKKQATKMVSATNVIKDAQTNPLNR